MAGYGLSALFVVTQNTVSTFDEISRVSALFERYLIFTRKVSMVHRNFERTGEGEEPSRDESTNRRVRGDILGPAANLLAIHYKVGQLKSFQNETMNQAKSSSLESKPPSPNSSIR